MIDRRYYLLMGLVIAIFCAGTLVMGVDTQTVARRSLVQQKENVSVMNEQLRQDCKPETADAVVMAGY